ncbi:MAG TPA: DUF4350 domain-containing protein [Nitrososphaerales archaeon]|nr:DUF4350 domain-containing protein [Nitrososphaerales archaeon]
MKMGNFFTMLSIVAIVAIIYSPSVIGTSIPLGAGSTSPTDTLQGGTSTFLGILRSSGYHVVVANDTLSSISATGNEKVAYFLIGADNALSTAELQSINSRFNAGSMSLLIAEGNKTNEQLISSVLGASVNGVPILDPLSTFEDKRVFDVILNLGSGGIDTGVIDIASPISISRGSVLRPVASSSSSSYDEQNATVAPRVVVAAGTNSKGSNALLITDSAPFTNAMINSTGEQSFVMSMVNWVTQGDKNTVIVLDNAHYSSQAQSRVSFGVPIGPIFASLVELALSSSNSLFGPSAVSLLPGFSIFGPLLTLAVALGVLCTIYFAIKRWYATEAKANDDQPLPEVEQKIVAQSRARTDFLQMSRKKSFYLATLARLYEVLDDITLRELGSSITTLRPDQLASKLGPEDARQASELFARISRFYEYATGKRRFIFPPVLRWKSVVSDISNDVEKFLNKLDITMTGAREKDSLEYATRRH